MNQPHNSLRATDGSIDADYRQMSTTQTERIPASVIVSSAYYVVEDEDDVFIEDGSIMDIMAKQAIEEDLAGKTIPLK